MTNLKSISSGLQSVAKLTFGILVAANLGCAIAVDQISLPVEKAETVGGNGGKAFESTVDGGVLVGLNTWEGEYFGHKVVSAIQPVFQTTGGIRIGGLFGHGNGEPVSIMAKDGYAIGGVVAKGGDRLDGFKVIFMKRSNTGLDASQSYESDWVGGIGGGSGKLIGGTGRLAIGVTGKSGDALDRIGLIFRERMQPEAAKSVVPAYPVPAPIAVAPTAPPIAAESKSILHTVEEVLAAADTSKSLKPFDSVDRDALQQMTRSLQANNGKEIEIEIQPVQPPKRESEAQFRWQLSPVKSGASVFTPILVVNAFRDDAPTALSIVPGKSATLHGVIQRCSVAYSNGPLLYVYIQASSLTGNPTAQQSKPGTTTSTVPEQPAKAISLKTGWDGPMQGGSKSLEDLAYVLNGYAKADPNPQFEDVEIYGGVKYLMPLDQAVVALGIKSRLPAMKKVVTPGFPRESLNFTSFDGLFEGHYNRMDIVTDMANQVVSIQLVDEHPKDTSYVSYLLKGNWLTYNFVGYRVKALTTLSVDYSLEAYDARQARWIREKPEYLARYYPTTAALRVFTYLMDRHQIGKPDKRLEETMWCVPRPFASLLLYCASKVQR